MEKGMNDLVFKPVEPLQGLNQDLKNQINQAIEQALDRLMESNWFVELVDERIGIVVDIMNEEAEADAISE
jgi:PleD family two-component response regulator